MKVVEVELRTKIKNAFMQLRERIDQGTKESDWAEQIIVLARFAIEYPELFSSIFELFSYPARSIEMQAVMTAQELFFPECREQFVCLVNQQDPNKPKFGELPDEFFPPIANLELRKEDRAVTETNLTYALFAGGVELASLSVEITNSLTTIAICPPALLLLSDSAPSVNLDRFGKEIRTYVRLKWYANITNFFIAEFLRRNKLGSTWLQSYIYPYLRKNNIDVVAVTGSCLDNESTAIFWNKQGFKTICLLNRIANRQEELRYLLGREI